MELADQDSSVERVIAGRTEDDPGFFDASGSSPGEHALAYAELGMAVFPLKPGAKEPLGGNGHLDATTDPEHVRTMWEAEPEAGIGNRPGEDEVVIDVDPRSGGDESFAELVGRLGPLPATITTETGGGGRHYRLRIPPDTPLPRQLARGIDLKGHNGYVVLPPSRHPNGSQYRWTPYCGPEEQNVAVLPEAWVEQLRKMAGIASGAATAEAAGIDPARVLAGVPEGQRDDALFRYASQMRRRGFHRAEAEALVLLAAQNCKPPFPADEALKKVEQAYRYPSRADDTVQEPLESLVVSAAQFLTEETEPAVSLLGDGVIAPGTLTILGGDDGVGKTMLVLNLSLSLAAGRDFLEMSVANPYRVLFVEAEGSAAHFKERLRTAAKSLGIDLAALNIYFVRQPEKLQINGPALTEILDELRPDLVVFDTVGYFYDGEENSNSDWKREVSKPLRQLARKWGTAFLLIQHLGKQNEQRAGKQRIRGGSAQSGDADTTLTLDRAKTNPVMDRVLTFAKIKNGPRLESLVLRFDEAGAVFNLIDEDAAIAGNPRLGDVQQIVLRARSIKSSELLSEIQQSMPVSKRTAEGLIQQAFGHGLIARRSKGVYGPPPDLESGVERHPEAQSIPQFPHVHRRAAEPAEVMDGSPNPQDVRVAEAAEPKRGAL